MMPTMTFVICRIIVHDVAVGDVYDGLHHDVYDYMHVDFYDDAYDDA